MRVLISTVALALFVSLAQPAVAENSASIVGVWKLTSFARKEVGGEKTVQVYGEDPTGYRVHTRGGHAFYMFFGKDRKVPGGTITDADRLEWFKSMITAGGTYKVVGDTFEFHADVATAQTMVGRDSTYHIELAGKKLTLTTDPVKNLAGGPDVVFITAYERAE